MPEAPRPAGGAVLGGLRADQLHGPLARRAARDRARRLAAGAEQVAQLTTLATQAGARIGTVRAFEKTQLQASTDGLTGLINRRTLETQLRDAACGRARRSRSRSPTSTTSSS